MAWNVICGLNRFLYTQDIFVSWFLVHVNSMPFNYDIYFFSQYDFSILSFSSLSRPLGLLPSLYRHRPSLPLRTTAAAPLAIYPPCLPPRRPTALCHRTHTLIAELASFWMEPPSPSGFLYPPYSCISLWCPIKVVSNLLDYLDSLIWLLFVKEWLMCFHFIFYFPFYFSFGKHYADIILEHPVELH